MAGLEEWSRQHPGEGLGLFFLGVGIYLYFVWLRHALNRWTARRTLPALAEELGLRATPGHDARHLGTLEGEYRGYPIGIHADDPSKIRIALQRPPRLWLRSPGGWLARLALPSEVPLNCGSIDVSMGG